MASLDAPIAGGPEWPEDVLGWSCLGAQNGSCECCRTGPRRSANVMHSSQRPDHRLRTQLGTRPPSLRSKPNCRSGSPLSAELLSELRGKSVHVHLVVLVVRPWSDRAFNHLTHSVDRLAFSDADAETVIGGRCMDRQRNVGRKPSFERLGLGGLKALGVVNSVDDCHKHGSTVHSSGSLRGNAAPLLAHPIMPRSGASAHPPRRGDNLPAQERPRHGHPRPDQIEGSGAALIPVEADHRRGILRDSQSLPDECKEPWRSRLSNPEPLPPFISVRLSC